MKVLAIFLALVLALLLGSAGPAAAAPVDYSLYAELLGKYVQDGVVDYAGLKRERAKLDKFLEQLSRVDPDQLTRQEQMAFYINAYNAWTLWLILTKYPDIKSIKELGGIFSSPWSKEIARINGKLLTLDNIEHDILRPRFKDPRVHFAVNCASKSCPPLFGEPYTGAKLDRQLDEVTVSFINDPRQTILSDGTLYVNKVMDWYAEDFDHDPAAFVRNYARGRLKKRLDRLGGKVKVDYLPYDWSLNGK